MPSGPRRSSWIGATSCAGCSMRIRPRLRCSVRPRTPSWRRLTGKPATCCGQPRAIWPWGRCGDRLSAGGTRTGSAGEAGMTATGTAANTTAAACTRPGCTGSIEDGYCNVCGLAASGRDSSGRTASGTRQRPHRQRARLHRPSPGQAAGRAAPYRRHRVDRQSAYQVGLNSLIQGTPRCWADRDHAGPGP